MTVVDNVLNRFNAVKYDKKHSEILTIERPSGGLYLPCGESATAWNYVPFPSSFFRLQGIQKRKNGGFILTGGSSGNCPNEDSRDNVNDQSPGGYFYSVTSQLQIDGVVVSPWIGSGTVVAYTGPGIAHQEVELPNNQLGGCQVVSDEDILVVGSERVNDEDTSAGTSSILFYQLSTTAAPLLLSNLIIPRYQAGNYSAGAVGLTRRGTDDSSGWLLVVANYDAKRLDFYQNDSATLDRDTKPFSPCGSWSDSAQFFTQMSDRNWEPYQNTNLFRQADGSLWLIGMHMNSSSHDDWADLYSLYHPTYAEIGWSNGQAPPASGWSLTKMSHMHFVRHDQKYNDDGPRFDYGSGYYYYNNNNDGGTPYFEVYDCEKNLSGDGRTQIQCSRWTGQP